MSSSAPERAGRRLAVIAAVALLLLLIVILAPYHLFWRASPQTQIAERIAQYDEFVRTMDADAIAHLFTENGEMWNAGTLVQHGPDAIRTFLHSFDGKVRVESQQTTIQRIVVTGRSATVFGTYRETARKLDDNSVVTATGEIRSIWVPCHESWCIERVETTPK